VIDYEYPDQDHPDLDAIRDAVAASSMTDKGISCSLWSADDGVLHVFWNTELSGADKALLDAIVAP